MIGQLNARLASGAQLSVADGVLWVALQLFRETHFQNSFFAVSDHLGFPVHHADVQPTPGRTERADAGFPCGDTGKQRLFGNKPNELRFGIAATRKCCACSGGSCCFDEISAIHEYRLYGPRFSSGKPRNRSRRLSPYDM